MKMTVLKRGKDVDEDMTTDIDFLPLLESGSIHYVSLAIPGLKVVSHLILHAGGFDTRERNDFMLRVNTAKETGTLYPRLNITLLPAARASYTGMDDSVHNIGAYSEAEIVAQILDAFKANSQYVKSSVMYFDFRNLGVSESHYLSCLKTAMQQVSPDELPEEVITWEARE